MTQLAKKTLIIVCSSLLMTSITQAADKLQPGISMSLESRYQEYDDDNASFNSFTLSPTLSADQWQIGISLPWYSFDATFYSNGKFPQLSNYCSQVLSLTPTQRDWLINRGRLSNQTLSNCETLFNNNQQDETISGMGDANLFTSYVINLQTLTPMDLVLGLDISLDNGDYEEGLGKGSTNTTTSIGLYRYGLHWIVNATAGYIFVNPTDSAEALQDYSYITLGAGYRVNDTVTLGMDYALEGAYLEGEDQLTTLTGYTDLQLNQQWSLYLYFTDYLDTESAPDLEAGAEIRFSM